MVEYPGYGSNITEDGITGINTINALLRAFQIELGITNTSNNFGNTTTTLFNTQYPNGIQQQTSGDPSESNVYGIIQGTLWCKGYYIPSQVITKHFYSGTGNAIINLKTDAGIIDSTSTVTLNVMKALLSLTYFVCTPSGSENIRTMQKYLNRNYEAYIGLSPCDGVYSRSMNKALIYALQAEEGLSVASANGNFGQTTRRCCPTIPYSNIETDVNYNQYSTDSINKFIYILKIALYVNGYGSGELSSIYDSTVVSSFQSNMMINSTGVCNLSTWLSLLTSCGDTSRNCIACDTISEMTEDNLAIVINNGISIIGRYLTNTPNGSLNKKIRDGELNRIFNNNCKLIPIFQQSGNSASYFTQSKGTSDLKIAFDAALSYRLPANSVIYFAVDFDATDAQISSNVMPYFSALKTAAQNYCMPNYYQIGIYGSRNVCQKIINAGNAVTSYVSDMSTGFSGNMGFRMPTNWTFDQFFETTISYDDMNLNIDKVAYNENSDYSAVNSCDTHAYITDGYENFYLGTAHNITDNPHFGSYFTVYSSHVKLKWTLTSEIDNNEFLAVSIMVWRYGINDAPVAHAYDTPRDIEHELEFDAIPGCDYRISYYCSHRNDGSGPEVPSGDVAVYIDTVDSNT